MKQVNLYVNERKLDFWLSFNQAKNICSEKECSFECVLLEAPQATQVEASIIFSDKRQPSCP